MKKFITELLAHHFCTAAVVLLGIFTFKQVSINFTKAVAEVYAQHLGVSAALSNLVKGHITGSSRVGFKQRCPEYVVHA